MESNSDLVRHYPIAQVPPAWALNDIFLRMIDGAQRRWDQAGYDWKFGMEISFDLESPKNYRFRPEQKNPDWVREDAQQMHFDELLTRMHAIGRNTRPARKAVATMRQETAKIAAMHGITEEQVTEQLDQIDANLRSPIRKVKEDGMQNAFMAWIHTRPYSEGGVSDLIEPRFGDYLHGVGWWDAYQHGELRTPTLDDPFEVIASHHRMVEVLHTQAPKFNLMAHFLRGHTPHIHFSIWDRKTGRNMMDFDDATLDFRTRVAAGFVDWARHAPYTFQDMRFQGLDMDGQFDIDSWRVENGLRQCEGHWELRRSASNMTDNSGEIGHLARDLAFVMGQSLLAVMTPEERAPVAFIEEHYFEESPDTHLVARHRFGYRHNQVAAMLSHARLRDDGSLYCPFGLLRWAVDPLKNAVGRHAVGDFKARRHDIEPLFDLNTIAGWEYLFRSLKYEDGKLQTAHLAPEVAALFDEIEVVGTRKVLNAMAVSLKHDAASLLLLNERFRPLAARLPDVLPEHDWETVRAHYHDLFKHYLDVYSADLVGQLADTFRAAADDVESPREMILDLVGHLRSDASQITMALMLTEQRSGDKGDERKIGRAVSDPSPMERLQPHFVKAVEARIVQERAADLPDNRQIAFLEAAREYCNDNFLDFGDTLNRTFGPGFDSIMSLIVQEKLTSMSAELLSITHPIKMMAQLWESFRRCDFKGDAILERLTHDEAAWQEYWKTCKAHYAPIIDEHKLAAFVCDEIEKRMDMIFEDLKRMAAGLDKDDAEAAQDAPVTAPAAGAALAL